MGQSGSQAKSSAPSSQEDGRFEALKRLQKYVDSPECYISSQPMSEWKSVPQEARGLGYEWIPLTMRSLNPERLPTSELPKIFSVVIHPCINAFVGCDRTKVVVRDLEVIKTEVVNNAIHIGSRQRQWFELGAASRFFDPQEVDDAYDYLRKNYHFIGIMGSMDEAEVSLKDHQQPSLFIDDENANFMNPNLRSLPSPFNLGKYKVYVACRPREGPAGRIFNWWMDIAIDLA